MRLAACESGAAIMWSTDGRALVVGLDNFDSSVHVFDQLAQALISRKARPITCSGASTPGETVAHMRAAVNRFDAVALDLGEQAIQLSAVHREVAMDMEEMRVRQQYVVRGIEAILSLYRKWRGCHSALVGVKVRRRSIEG